MKALLSSVSPSSELLYLSMALETNKLVVDVRSENGLVDVVLLTPF